MHTHTMRTFAALRGAKTHPWDASVLKEMQHTAQKNMYSQRVLYLETYKTWPTLQDMQMNKWEKHAS